VDNDDDDDDDDDNGDVSKGLHPRSLNPSSTPLRLAPRLARSSRKDEEEETPDSNEDGK